MIDAWSLLEISGNSLLIEKPLLLISAFAPNKLAPIPWKVENIKEIGLQIGNLFANSILEVLILAELGNVDPFGQDAVEKQKNFLK